MKPTVVAAALAAIFLPSVAALADPVIVKAGEWVMTMQGGPKANGPMTHKVCFKTDRTPADLRSRAPGAKNCDTPNVSTSGDTVTVDLTCKGPMGGKMTMHSVIVSLGTDSFRNETEMTMDNAPQGMPNPMKMVTEAKRTGPCQQDDLELK